MKEIQKLDITIDGIHKEELIIEEPFIDITHRFSHIPGTVLLLSGGNLDCARYHILGVKPWLSLKGHGRQMELKAQDKTLVFDANPFDTLRALLNRFKLNFQDFSIPISSGLLGYLAYDLKDHLETLPRTSIDDLGLPQILMYAPSIYLVHDKKENRTSLLAPKLIDSKKEGLKERIMDFKKTLASHPSINSEFCGDTKGFRSNFAKEDYEAAIAQIREYIASGHVYQVNMSQRFDMKFKGSAFGLFKSLYASNPAPFFAYIQAGDHQIVSTSPERFILQQEKSVETRPIKGTRPRGKTGKEDENLKQALLESKKDDAELSMIVDLLRNDIGKVCKGGSVHVAQHKRIEAYENVYHLVSVVKGELADKKDSVDLISATFPGGSITGCPKIRTMEIIDELEPSRRHIYTGSIGYISFHNTMDLSIAIRTATIFNNKIFFSAGGGIVYDSDPSDEYEETLHKGQTMFNAFKNNNPSPETEPVVWINGSLKPCNLANIPVMDQGVQYGYGFFETIRVDKGIPGYFSEHLTRFNHAWKELFFDKPLDLTWDKIIHQVIKNNSLENRIAAVKIIATKGDPDSRPYHPTLIVLARPYTHRLKELSKTGLNLSIYPEPRQTFLANHKTLNYLYYLLAGKWAKSRGADEALILNPDGTLSETNTTNILLIKGQNVICPISPSVLKGVMEKAVTGLLLKWGYTSFQKKVLPKDLFEADQVLLTNSLMGAVPVLSVDGETLSPPTDLWQRINDEVLNITP